MSEALGAAPRSWFQKLAPRSAERDPDRVVERALRRIQVLPAGRQQRQLVGEAHPHATVVRADRPGPDPHDLARRAQLVEQALAVVLDPGGEHVVLERRRDDRCAGEQPERLDHAVDAPARRRDAVPRGEESGQCLLLDGFDLAAQRGERAAAELTQHLGVAPLAADTVGPELPRTTRPSASSAASAPATRGSGMPSRATTSRSTNGPWLRA